jgi:hypothetical protein
MIAWSYKYRVHQPYVYPDNTLDYSSNFLKMMFSVPAAEYHPDPAVARALNLLLVLHADHGQNCSASAVRLVGSGQANIFSSISAGIHALSGPLHGGANQAVLEMLQTIHDSEDDLDRFVARAKDKDDPFRLMGFGHRVYKNHDPRARIMQRACHEVLSTVGVDDPLLALAIELERVALEEERRIRDELRPTDPVRRQDVPDTDRHLLGAQIQQLGARDLVCLVASAGGCGDQDEAEGGGRTRPLRWLGHLRYVSEPLRPPARMPRPRAPYAVGRRPARRENSAPRPPSRSS